LSVIVLSCLRPPKRSVGPSLPPEQARRHHLELVIRRVARPLQIIIRRPAFGEYEKTTGRTFPVAVLEGVPAPA
jgi:hypothetical protein